MLAQFLYAFGELVAKPLTKKLEASQRRQEAPQRKLESDGSRLHEHGIKFARKYGYNLFSLDKNLVAITRHDNERLFLLAGARGETHLARTYAGPPWRRVPQDIRNGLSDIRHKIIEVGVTERSDGEVIYLQVYFSEAEDLNREMAELFHEMDQIACNIEEVLSKHGFM